METKITNAEFAPFDITFKVKSIDELRELYEIVGEFKDVTGANIVYNKIGNILEDLGFELGLKAKIDQNEIEEAAQLWFDKTQYCDQKDGFIAGVKYRRRVIKTPSKLLKG
jgi:hypothetical protein